MTRKLLIIITNALASVTVAGIGLAGMVQRDPVAGGGYEGSTLLWIGGLVTLFLIPLEICLIKSRKRD